MGAPGEENRSSGCRPPAHRHSVTPAEPHYPPKKPTGCALQHQFWITVAACRSLGGGTFVGPVGPVGPVGRWVCRQDQPLRQVIRTAKPPPGYADTDSSPRGVRGTPVLDNRNGLRIRGGGTFVGPVGPVGPVGRWACRQDQPLRQVYRGKKPPPGYADPLSIPRANLTCSHGSLPIRPIAAYPAYCPALPIKPASPTSHQATNPQANHRRR